MPVILHGQCSDRGLPLFLWPRYSLPCSSWMSPSIPEGREEGQMRKQT